MKKLLFILFFIFLLGFPPFSNGENLEAITWTFSSIYNKEVGIDNSKIFYDDPQKLASLLDVLKKNGFNTVTVTIIWDDVEPTQGSFTYEKYDKFLSVVEEKGFSMILLLVGVCGGETTGVPNWFWNSDEMIKRKQMSIDFDNRVYSCIDISNESNHDLLFNFYDKSTKHFKSKFSDSIYAIGIVTSQELEIKYSQNFYSWRPYSEKAQDLFRIWLERKYENISSLNESWKTDYKYFNELKLPKINYNTFGPSGKPDTDNSFSDLMLFREDLLYNFTKNSVSVVKSNDVPVIGYFGQFFTTDDAIYVSQIINRTTELFDVIVIDFNFFDGFDVVDKKQLGSIMVNYAKNLGYKKVILGVYLERLSPYLDNSIVYDYIQNSYPSNFDGLEVGNIQRCQIEQWEFLHELKNKPNQTSPNDSKSVAIYVSAWNFYKWHGDISTGHDMWNSSLYASYEILTKYGKYNVDIIGDNQIRNNNLKNYDVLFVLSQPVIPGDVKEKIRLWANEDKLLIQDWDLGNWDVYGEAKSDWLHEEFGIEKNIQWHTDDVSLISDYFQLENSSEPFIINIDKNLPLHRTASFFDFKPNYASLLENESNSLQKNFIVGNNTLIFGFQPHLIYMYDEDLENRQKAIGLFLSPLDSYDGIRNKIKTNFQIEENLSSKKYVTLRSIQTLDFVCIFPWYEQVIDWYLEDKIPNTDIINSAKFLHEKKLDNLEYFNQIQQ